MTLTYLRAIAATLQWEGERYTDHPADRGGPTRYGLTLAFLRGVAGAAAIHPRELTLMDAVGIYHAHVWQPLGLDRLPGDLAGKVFDMAVNMGAKQAVKLLQRALNDAGAEVAVDGKLGPMTVGAAQSTRTATVMARLCARQAEFYRTLAQKPGQGVFLQGWLRRAEYDPARTRVNG